MEYAFNGSGLKEIVIPNSVKTLQAYVFRECKSLTSVTIGEGLTVLAPGLFYSCTKLDNVIIPNNITTIGDYVFSECKNLKNITIGEGVTSIGNSVFEQCDGLVNVTIPNSVKTLGDDVFRDCSNLNTVFFGNSVTSIGYDPFSFCSSKLKSIYFTSPTPPAVTKLLLGSGTNLYKQVTIYVPTEYLNTYKEAWKGYKIAAFDY